MLNRHGLPRYIPADIKREVRKKCGFGCVICGKALIEYEHIDPEFHEARVHSADGITLLCPEHHAKKTRGHLSIETVKRHMSEPRAKQRGFSHEAFDIGDDYPEIILGDFRGTRVETLLEIEGEKIFSIAPPENNGEPFLIRAC